MIHSFLISPCRDNGFSFNLCVQTRSEAHPASYPMGKVSHFPGVKRGQDVTLTTHPYQETRPRMSGSFTSSPPWHQHGCSETALLLLFFRDLLQNLVIPNRDFSEELWLCNLVALWVCIYKPNSRSGSHEFPRILWSPVSTGTHNWTLPWARRILFTFSHSLYLDPL
jgi:hypothetical protein